jgi:glycosyltransferase involved in cell wall biosynthesis
MSVNAARIVHFTTVHSRDDTRIFSKQCVSLAKAGYHVELIAPGDGASIKTEEITCRPLNVPRNRMLRMTLGQIRMLGAVLASRADIFHFHDPELLPTGLILRLLGRRVIFDSHEHIARDMGEKAWLPAFVRPLARAFGRLLECSADRFMSAVVVTTPGMRTAYPSGRTVLLRNLPKREEFSSTASWHGRGSIVCYVGLVSEFRGSRQIARLADLTSARVVVAGRLPENERLKLCAEPGWQKVDYRGSVDRQGVVTLLSTAQVGLATLLPMRNFDDSIPTKLLEYLAAGIPVVASDFTSWRELTEGRDCVIFVDPLDDKAIARAVNELLADPGRAQRMGSLGRDLVMERYVWEREFEALLALYSHLLNNAAPSELASAHSPPWEKRVAPPTVEPLDSRAAGTWDLVGRVLRAEVCSSILSSVRWLRCVADRHERLRE